MSDGSTHWLRHSLRYALLALVLCLAAAGVRAAETYRPGGDCAGFPAIALQTPKDLCVGLVASGLGFARGVAVAGEAIYVTDMGGWHQNRGRLLRIGHFGHDAPEVLLERLNEPNSLAVAPGGALYMALLGRIVRVRQPEPGAALEDVVTGLPQTGRHPLPSFVFADDGSLFINVGSATDHCEGPRGAAPDPHADCPERATVPPRAGIVRAMPRDGEPVAWPSTQPVAFGLRNSMGLALTPGGRLIAAVNARDAIDQADPSLSDADLPHDTLDVIADGADYGWPYCYDENVPSPEYRSYDCGRMHAPTLLLPPHAAPLGLLAYRSGALPGLQGRLLIPYHGYRAAGHRIMSIGLTNDGAVRGQPEPLIWGWDGAVGRMPMGAPVALAEMADGSVLITEDHNGTLLRLGRR